MSYKKNPLLSVITVVFNGSKNIENTILSVTNQDYQRFQYIIIDGGSSDGTLEIIKKYENKIDYWISENDLGIYDAMNKGLDIAIGDWVCFMNAGDVFCDSLILSQVFGLNIEEDTKVIYGNYKVVYPDKNIKSINSGKPDSLWKGSQFCHQATFVKTNFHKSQKFNIYLKIVADFEFFYKTWKSGHKFFYVPISICLYQSGGISDLNRIDTLLGWWSVVEKNIKVFFYFSFRILIEHLKVKLKIYVN
jgi:glycosyltransferase involved in cell wall biosynthesis